MQQAHISTLYRYPIKGLSGEALPSARLQADAYFPNDRLFAIENGPSGFDADEPEHQPKIKFLMLMRNERLARLQIKFDEISQVLTIFRDGRQVSRGDLASPIGRSLVEQFFAAFCKEDLRGAPKLLSSPDGFRFTDSRKGFVSIINLNSVRDLARVIGAEVDPLRFRGNIMVEGLAPWGENDLVGREIRIGTARLEVLKRIERCAATNVNLQTAMRDLNIPKTLMTAFGHTDCGIYARVIDGAEIKPGDMLTPA